MRKQAIISIHAPRAGRDQYNENHHGPAVHNFNPRAPCGARLSLSLHLCHVSLISIHAPRAGRDSPALNEVFRLAISIHAPRAGRDAVQVSNTLSLFLFQSTRPVRGATRGAYGAGYIQGISIHAPRAGRDRRWRPGRHRTARYFNPRAPCGARLVESVAAGVDKAISIHAPRAGRDGQRVRALLRVNAISIHAPRAGRDQAAAPVDVAGLISIHAPRAGRDAGRQRCSWIRYRFQSTRPVRGAT